MQQYGDEMQAIGALMAEAGQTQSLILNSEWRQRIGQRIHMVRIVNDEVQEMAVPVRFTHTHGAMMNVSFALDQAMAALEEGIENVDADRIEQMMLHISQAQSELSRATIAMQTEAGQ